MPKRTDIKKILIIGSGPIVQPLVKMLLLPLLRLRFIPVN